MCTCFSARVDLSILGKFLGKYAQVLDFIHVHIIMLRFHYRQGPHVETSSSIRYMRRFF